MHTGGGHEDRIGIVQLISPDGSRHSDQRPSLIVGIGASAGGLEAFKNFFLHMPPASGMAFVLIQHLAPDHVSALAELLAGTTRMHVQEAVDGVIVEAGNVYVIPPDATLTILHGALQLTRPAPPRQYRWPIDTFFASLAVDQGNRAACIVLAGGGSDGARGLKLVKEHGGLTLAQSDADHVALAGMPENAMITGLVDHVLPVAELPAMLLAYRDGCEHLRPVQISDGAGTEWTESLIAICGLLRSRVGHDFSQYKENTLIRRIQRRMQVMHIENVADYTAHLKADAVEPQNLFRELLIGVTEFFRDPEAFRTLYDTAILPLVENKGASDTLRIWVPGCATGEEAYTIAILISEALEHRTGAPKVQIFATDIDERALASARAGRFRKSLEGLSDERRARWFQQQGDGYCIRKEIREMCIFSLHGVFRDPPFSRLDLISCRNLLIYLSTELQDRLARLFHYALVPGGLLFLGSSESMGRHGDLFVVKSKKHRLYISLGATHVRQHFIPMTTKINAPTGIVQTERPTSVIPFEHDLDLRARQVLEKHSPAYVVIDVNHHAVRFSGNTSPYLGPSSGTASLNIFSLLHRGLRASARSAVRESAAAGLPVTREGPTVTVDGQRRGLRLTVEPLLGSSSDNAFYVLVFNLQDAWADDGAPMHAADETLKPEMLHALEHELDATRIHLQSVIIQLEGTQQEMKSATEEYQSVNEELQSSNEELETSKEETQSVNEELQTVNAELVVKNEALARLNSDLQNLLESTQIATLFLDTQLNVTRFTPALTELFHLRDSDRGRPVTEIAARILYPELSRDVTQVLRTLAVIERIVRSDGHGPVFLLRMRPYRTLDNRIDGVVLTFVDITDRELASEQARLAAIVESSKDVIIGYGLDGTIISWNASAKSLLGYSREEIIGKSLSLLSAHGSEAGMQAIAAAMAQGSPSAESEMTWRHRDGQEVVVAVICSPVKNASQPSIAGSLIARDISERVRAARHVALMYDELNHRVKNTLSIVQAIALQTLANV
jgi:two-component system CheB/CheR fusion protein